jgi:hypothetical protein
MRYRKCAISAAFLYAAVRGFTFWHCGIDRKKIEV